MAYDSTTTATLIGQIYEGMNSTENTQQRAMSRLQELAKREEASRLEIEALKAALAAAGDSEGTSAEDAALIAQLESEVATLTAIVADLQAKLEEATKEPTKPVETKAPLPRVGVNATFAEWGFGSLLWKTVLDSRTSMIRAGFRWHDTEKTKGVINFGSAKACQDAFKAMGEAGIPIFITAQPLNPIYDGGKSVYSDEGIAAFTKWLLASIEETSRYTKVLGVALNNECNSEPNNFFVDGSKAKQFTATIARRVIPAIRARYPDLPIISPSLNHVGTGWVRDYFDLAGPGGDLGDGVDSHPYHFHAESNYVELLELQKVLKPLDKKAYVLEWSCVADGAYSKNDTEMQTLGGKQLLKMYPLMRMAEVECSAYFALVNAWWPYHGLNKDVNVPKPQLKYFHFIQDICDQSDEVVDIAQGKTYLHAYRMGDYVMYWGADRSVTHNGVVIEQGGTNAKMVSYWPTLIKGATSIVFGNDKVYFDTINGYGPAHNNYVFEAGKELRPLYWHNGDFTSFYRCINDGDVGAQQATFWCAASKVGPRAFAPHTGSFAFRHKGVVVKSTGDGVNWRLVHNGVVLDSGHYDPSQEFTKDWTINAKEGDSIALLYDMNNQWGADQIRHQTILVDAGSSVYPSIY